MQVFLRGLHSCKAFSIVNALKWMQLQNGRKIFWIPSATEKALLNLYLIEWFGNLPFMTVLTNWINCITRSSDLVDLMMWKIWLLYSVRHIKCYRSITPKLLIISKNVSDKSFSVREGCHIGPPYFLSVEPCIFFRWHYYRF